jgi:hypothetical protein
MPKRRPRLGVTAAYVAPHSRPRKQHCSTLSPGYAAEPGATTTRKPGRTYRLDAPDSSAPKLAEPTRTLVAAPAGTRLDLRSLRLGGLRTASLALMDALPAVSIGNHRERVVRRTASLGPNNKGEDCLRICLSPTMPSPDHTGMRLDRFPLRDVADPSHAAPVQGHFQGRRAYQSVRPGPARRVQTRTDAGHAQHEHSAHRSLADTEEVARRRIVPVPPVPAGTAVPKSSRRLRLAIRSDRGVGPKVGPHHNVWGGADMARLVSIHEIELPERADLGRV